MLLYSVFIQQIVRWDTEENNTAPVSDSLQPREGAQLHSCFQFHVKKYPGNLKEPLALFERGREVHREENLEWTLT